MSKARELLEMVSAARPAGGKRAEIDIFEEDIPLEQSGWEIQKQRRLAAKVNKAVADWNQKDILKYVGHLYYEATGQSLIFTWAKDYYTLRDIASRLKLQLHITECSNDLLKQYLDHAFEKFVVPYIGKGKKFWMGYLATPELVLDFAASRKKGEEATVSDKVVTELTKAEVETLSLENLDAAFKINAKYFVSTYGAVLFVNYLMLVKKQTKEMAIQTAQKAIDKAKANVEVAATTMKYSPYPTWLPFTDVEVLGQSWLSGSSVSADNQVLSFMKVLTERV